MNKAKKSNTKSKNTAKGKPQPSSAVLGFAVVSIAFLLVTDAYYLWQLMVL